MHSILPEKGRPYEEILQELATFASDDPQYKEGKTWSLVYYLDQDYTDFLGDAYGQYFSANGLNPTAFKSLKRLEKDVLTYTAELLHADEKACGVMTSGGTESCLLAVKTYRDRGRAKGIKKPEMILPETAHVAWDKGGEYFGVKIKRAKLASDYTVDVAAVQKLITRNTVLIVGGAPEYPHGLIDPIEQLGALAQKHDIPFHVDACVGGYILPFLEAHGVDLPLWDFRVPGVTSMSADIHKYGFAAKGASCILYRSMDYFKHQIFVQQDWPGGVFASPALLGTRPGGAYAAAWASIQANGRDGYMKLAERTLQAVQALKTGIAGIEGLELIGDPKASLLSFRSTSPDLNIFAVGDVMEEKGWLVDRLQRPDALHAMVTASHDAVIDQYVQDLTEAVAIVRADPSRGRKGQAATYGMISHIPLRGLVKKQVASLFAASYQLDAEEIDLTNSDALSGDASSSRKTGVINTLISWYVQRKMKKNV